MRMLKLSNLIAVLLAVSWASAATRLVPDEYPNIQAAIDACSDGDVVIVADGIYTGEGNYSIGFRGKAITVRSIDPNDPTVVAATIVDCNQWNGGFIFWEEEDANSVLSGFTIVNCWHIRSAGSGISCYGSSPLITNCVIARNPGGGIHLDSSSFPTIENCIISENSTAGDGAGICCLGGGLVIKNSLVTGNKSRRSGGGFYCHESSLVISGCTIAGNAAEERGGGIYSAWSSTVSDSILWGNYAPADAVISGDCTVRHSSVENGWAGDGNIDADPCFAAGGYWGHIGDPNIHVEPSDPNAAWVDGDYHLKSEYGRWEPNSKVWVFDEVTSLCIDGADPSADWSAELWPHGERVNLGAYGGTAQASMSPNDVGNVADMDLDGFVYRTDLPLLLGAWLSDAAPLREDLTRDGIVNFPDFSVFAHNYKRPPLPAQAEIVSPLDRAVDAGRAPPLDWLSDPNALWHDVYLGTESPGAFQARVSATTFRPNALEKNTWYYWRIDEMNPAGTTTGEVWTFQTGPYPAPATNPDPADDAVEVSYYSILSWQGGDGATSHDVYFGTASPGDFQGNQVETTFDPGNLLGDTTYYWRIDEVNDLGTTTGAVWSFTTGSGKGRRCFPADTLVWADGRPVPIVEVRPGQKVRMVDSAGEGDGKFVPIVEMRPGREVSVFNNAAEVEWLQEHGVGAYDCYDMTFETGNTLVVVHSHNFLTVAGQWVAVENLTSGSKLQSLNGPITVTSIVKRAMPFVGNAYNLKIKGANLFFVGKDGVAAVDCSKLPKE